MDDEWGSQGGGGSLAPSPRRRSRGEETRSTTTPSASTDDVSTSNVPPSSLPSGVAVTLERDDSVVHLVGVAHVSRASAEEATRIILETRPDVVVLELDRERFEALRRSSGPDSFSGSPARPSSPEEEAARQRYGIPPPRSKLSYAREAMTGAAPVKLMRLAYSVAGALVGARAGGEFLAAAEAAEAVGARVVLGDRHQRVTMARLAAAAREEAARAAAAGPSPWEEGEEGDVGSESVESENDDGDFSSSSSSTSRRHPRFPVTKEDAAAARDARWREFLKAGGCPGADEAVPAFRRIVKASTSPSSSPTDGSARSGISLDDLRAVRECGRGVVEETRRKVLLSASGSGGKGGGAVAAPGDVWRQLEAAAAAEAAESIGGQREKQQQLRGQRAIARALERVLGAERDVILAHSLYRAAVGGGAGGDDGGGVGGGSGGKTVVGVIGAAHVPGVVNLWPTVDRRDVAEAARELSRLPGGGAVSDSSSTSSAPALLATGALLVALSLRRPKVALFVAGSAAAVATPFVVAAATAMERWHRLGAAIGEAAVRLDDEEGGGG